MASFIGTTNADTLVGTDSADTLDGRDGNDVIDGRGGADLMRGGRGDDIFHVDDAGDVVEELSGQGTDEVRSTISYVLGSNVENLTLLGSDAIDGTGNALNNRITGNDAANVIRGGGGTDIFVGGGGDDVYHVEAVVSVSKRGGYTFSGVDQVTEAAGGGIDTIYSNASLTLPSEVENLVLTGSLDLSAFGNAADNRIIGNSGRNFIQAHEGDDYIDGGAGADHMDGGAGNDTYVVDNATDVIMERFDGGTDRVISSISYQLHLELENLTLAGSAAIDGTGNYRDNILIGNDAVNLLTADAGNDLVSAGGGDDVVDAGMGDDLIDGGEGADLFRGGAGNDEFYVDQMGDRIVEAAGEGRDVVYARAGYALTDGAHVEVLSTASLGGTEAIDLTGNALAQEIYGNAGANILDGGGGADVLIGLAGDDIYHIGGGSETIIEGAGQGRDSVLTAGTHALNAGAEIESLAARSAAGTEVMYLVGNEFGQEVLGNAGNNYLDGGLGADVLTGYGAADTFAFTTALGGGNVDRILDFEAGLDRIGLDDGIFTGLAPGALAAGAFHVGAAAETSEHRIVYDQASGALYFDADGAGGADAVRFATLDAGTVLTANDFTVI